MEQLTGKPGKSAWPPARAAELLHRWNLEELDMPHWRASSLIKGLVDWIGGTKWLGSTELHIHRDILLNILQVQEIVFILNYIFKLVLVLDNRPFNN